MLTITTNISSAPYVAIESRILKADLMIAGGVEAGVVPAGIGGFAAYRALKAKDLYTPGTFSEVNQQMLEEYSQRSLLRATALNYLANHFFTRQHFLVEQLTETALAATTLGSTREHSYYNLARMWQCEHQIGFWVGSGAIFHGLSQLLIHRNIDSHRYSIKSVIMTTKLSIRNDPKLIEKATSKIIKILPSVGNFRLVKYGLKPITHYEFWEGCAEFEDNTRLESEVVLLATGYDGKSSHLRRYARLQWLARSFDVTFSTTESKDFGAT
ncbi:hypothetical protein Tco_1209571 [Tanacetum coccineum]